VSLRAILICVGLSAVASAGCVERAPLFQQEPEPGAPHLVLPGELTVYESDTATVAVDGGNAISDVRVQLLLLDSARNVLWRSGSAPVAASGRAAVAVDSVPANVLRGAELLVTGVVTDASGHRFYASDDSVPAERLADAAVRPARVWAGRRVRVPDRSADGEIAGAPEFGRAFFPMPGSAALGVLDLTGAGALAGSVAARGAPERLAYRSGVLAVLGSGGGELSFFRVSADGLSALGGGGLLPPLEMELDTTLAVAVRPTATALAMGCERAACSAMYAFLPSAVEVVEGAVASPGSAGVLRAVPVAAGPGSAGLVLPAYTDAVRGDTSATARVLVPDAPSGARKLVQQVANASYCLATSFGSARVAASADGVVYVASPAPGGGCGPGTVLLRLEAAASGTATASSLAIRNTLADNRLGNLVDLQLSEDDGMLLALADSSVLVLDPFLRIRGTLKVPGARAVAWLRGGSAARFAVADATGVSVYEAERLVAVARLAVGPTSGSLLFLGRAGLPPVISAAVPGGFVVVPVSAP
jgi:hypothetical protein